MVKSIIDLIKTAATVWLEVFGAKNKPEVVKAKVENDKVKHEDHIEKAVAKEDLKEIRKLLAE